MVNWSFVKAPRNVCWGLCLQQSSLHPAANLLYHVPVGCALQTQTTASVCNRHWEQPHTVPPSSAEMDFYCSLSTSLSYAKGDEFSHSPPELCFYMWRMQAERGRDKAQQWQQEAWHQNFHPKKVTLFLPAKVSWMKKFWVTSLRDSATMPPKRSSSPQGVVLVQYF